MNVHISVHYLYTLSVLKHSFVSIVRNCKWSCTYCGVNVNVTYVCTNGWDAPNLKGTFCLLACASLASFTVTCCRSHCEHVMYFRVLYTATCNME